MSRAARLLVASLSGLPTRHFGVESKMSLKVPIFVVGSSRSGTSLMQAVIQRMAGVSMTGETHYFDDLRPRIKYPKKPLDPPEQRLVEDYFLALSHRVYGLGGDPEQSRIGRDRLRSLALTYGGSSDSYFEAHCRLYNDPDQNPAEVWGEKTPRHAFRILEIADAFPSSQFVFMLRDPRAVVFSYSRWQDKFNAHAIDDPDLREKATIDASRAKRSYHPVIATLVWKAAARAAIEARKKLGDDRVRLVQYERLCLDGESELQELWSWLGVENPDADAPIPMTNSSFDGFGQNSGFSAQATDRWREALPLKVRRTVERVSGSVMEQLGFERDRSALDYLRVPLDLVGAIPSLIRVIVVNRKRMGRPIPYILRRAKGMLPS